MQNSRPPRSSTPPIDLTTPITFVKGVGEARAKLLARLGIATAGDLLTYYPKRHEDRTRFSLISDVADGEAAVFEVKVLGAETKSTRSGHKLTKVTVEDATAIAGMTFFNQPWLKDKFYRLRGRTIPVYATVARDSYDGILELKDPEYDDGTAPSSLMLGRIVPFYGLTEGLPQNTMRKIMQAAVPVLAPLAAEVIPPDLLDRLDLMSVDEAFRQYHSPESLEARDAARRRLVFEELFLLQVAMAMRRKHEVLDIPGIPFEIPEAFPSEFESTLPYQFTGAQVRVIDEILTDMRLPRPMNRLLQGDVGSGKTVVAAAAMAAAANAGYQAVVMAPTEILAEQHFLSMRPLLEPRGLAVEILTGSMSAKEKREARERLAMGLSPIAIGTHALIQEATEFRNLGLVVVDEQHRFGVEQRAALSRKGTFPDTLVMTATPIPRTLGLTVYGDLDISTINELPPGRRPIKTHVKHPADRQSVYSGIERLLSEGRQAYVVCPLVEESEKSQSRAATILAEELQRKVFPHRRIGLVHGQMPGAEKDAVMTAFRAGELDILVATTVIEVGVDVPNATVMVVEGAERFGLSQLHQLRGRVGRGAERSFCILIANPTEGSSDERLDIMANSTDGFEIAEQDLRLRGPGEFLGTKQSGMPGLKIANIISDVPILYEARAEALALLAADPGLSAPQHILLRKAIERDYAEIALARVS